MFVINFIIIHFSQPLSAYSVSQSNGPPPPYPFNQHHIELSCSLNLSSLSPSITPSLCSANSHSRSTTLHSDGHCCHQDQNHRGKRRQFSSPLEEHNRLNSENDFAQTPSKNRRCSSFNSQKCLNRKPSTTQQLHDSAMHNNITDTDKLKQLSIDVRDSRYEDNDENQREVNLFIVPTVLSPYSPVQLTPPCSPNFSSSTSLSPPSTITFPQNGCKSYRNQQQQAVSCYSRDDFSGGWINNRPPTPDIRRSELDLADLSDGTRVLVIQDTYLRAGTLYFGKVVQQAVLEVFPASIRHVPPGTRVCASWSEQLGVNLYPGTVAKVDSDEQRINNDCVPVDFDDGDHRQVPITDLRILPDYFTNLCELIAITGERNINSLTPCFFSSNLSLNGSINNRNSSEKNGRIISRIRRHSDLDHTVPISYHSWSQSTSPFIQKTMSSSSLQISRNFAVHSKSSFSENTSAKSTGRMKGNRRRKDSQLSSSSSNKTTECTISSLTSPTYTSTAATSVMSTRSLSPPPSVQKSEMVIDVNNHTLDDNYIMGCSNSDNNSEKIISSKNYLSEEFMMDYISIASTITTTNSSEECLSWQVFEKVGDCVQFGSGRDEIYLGEVKEIRWEQKKNSLIVVAAWYYQPLEAGKDGELVQDIKGALFTTEHKDENEAKCIKRRIKVAKTYGQFIQGYYDKPKEKDSLNLSRSLIHRDEKFSPKKDSVQDSVRINKASINILH
ncbi:Trinucleotide repeat-containing gene 18 protein [Schistosoma japonicum]|nr:Trinucleotide repeat-containing gene 18 protein [Schistosoma japonicum]